MKKTAIFLFGIFVILSIILLMKHSSILPTKKITVVASFYPLAEFAHQVGRDQVNVITIIPNGIEPHEYEPTPKDLAKINTAKLFIFNGNGLDPWAEKVQKSLKGKNMKVMNMSNYIDASDKK